MPTYSGGAGSYGGGGGAAVFGSNVAPVAMPTPSADLAQQFPNLAGANAGVSNVISSQLAGALNPDTVDMIKNAGAAWGVSSGMPGSGLSGNATLKNLGLTSMATQNQGVANYNSTIPTISSTQTVAPALQADVNLQNAVNAAAPNPSAAGNYAQSLFQQYLNNLNPGTNAKTAGTGANYQGQWGPISPFESTGAQRLAQGGEG